MKTQLVLAQWKYLKINVRLRILIDYVKIYGHPFKKWRLAMNVISTLAIVGFVLASIYQEISAILPNIVMGMLS